MKPTIIEPLDAVESAILDLSLREILALASSMAELKASRAEVHERPTVKVKLPEQSTCLLCGGSGVVYVTGEGDRTCGCYYSRRPELEKFFGTWPGDESDDELSESMKRDK